MRRVLSKGLLVVWMVLCLCGLSRTALAEGPHAKIVSTKETSSGVKLTWNSISGCDFYTIYRKGTGGEYKPVKAVADNGQSRRSCTDTTVSSGRSYTYLVTGNSRSNLWSLLGSTQYRYGGNTITIECSWKTGQDADLFVVFLEDVFYGTSPKGSKSVFIKQKWDGKTYPKVKAYPMYGITVTDDSDSRTAKAASIKKSDITGAKLVATNRACIKWSRSGMADGYVVYRRTGKTWKILAHIRDGSQTFCYDNKAKKGTYYYTVKAYQTVNGKKVCASWDKTGKKVTYSGKKFLPESGAWYSGTVYGPGMSSGQRTAVKKQVSRFFTQYITSDMTTLEKLLVAQLYMKETCLYASSWRYNGANNAWGALVYKNSKGYHEAQCSGFARAYVALCDAMGIPSRYVHANSQSSNPEHQWCFVKLGKKWYVMDPQGNATNGDMMLFVLLGSMEHKASTGMRWNESSYPAISKTSYDFNKIQEALNGYRVQNALKRIQKYR